MPYAFIRDVPASADQYREVRADLGDELPKGLVAHLVVQRPEGGLRYIDVWDTEADWERFRDQRLTPAVEAMFARHGLPTGINGPAPEPLDVIDAWTAA